MSLSSFSLVLGVFFYVFGFPLVFSDQQHLDWRKRFLRDENMLRIFATALIMLAVATLRTQWRITADAGGIVIAIAWMVLLKGFFMAWWPRRYSLMSSRLEAAFQRTPQMTAFVGFLMVLIGALFTYFGFILS